MRPNKNQKDPTNHKSGKDVVVAILDSENDWRHGKDEMNLVEHPWATLSWGKRRGEVMEITWEQRVGSKIVPARWEVSGHPKLGLPGPADECLYLVLMELTRENGMAQTIRFSRGDILRRLDWSHNQKNYQRLGDCFTRLKTVAVRAENAFWNAATKRYETQRNFSLLDDVLILEEKPGPRAQDELPLSFFKWSDVIYSSIAAGHMRSLNTDLALSLDLPISLRLFRYLDKQRYYGPKFEIGLRRLCEVHLGMKRNRYPSKYKERLNAAHEELVERNFLLEAHYEMMADGENEKIVYSFTSNESSHSPKAKDNSAGPERATKHKSTNNHKIDTETHPTHKNTDQSPQLDFESAENASDHSWSKAETELIRSLCQRGVTAHIAEQLVLEEGTDQIQLQLDCLHSRAPKDPAATLVQAIRNRWAPPASYLSTIEQQEQNRQAHKYQQVKREQQREQERIRQQEEERLHAENIQLDAMFEKLDERTRQRIDQEAAERLGVLGKTGRAVAALPAMRRNLLRERLEQVAQSNCDQLSERSDTLHPQ